MWIHALESGEINVKDTRFVFLKSPTVYAEPVYESRSASAWRIFLRDRRAMVASGILFLLIVLSALAFLSPYDPNELAVDQKLLPPSGSHWFGTDEYGRDYFTRILYGGQVSLAVGFFAMIISVSIGILVGTVSGYFGGVIDNILMRILDIFMSLPSFFLIMILSAYLKLGIVSIILIIGLLSWMEVARIVRAQTLTLKNREYVLYAKTTGASLGRIIWKHVIPGTIPSITVAASLNIAYAILTESSLSFLGLGIKQPDSSWGSMLNSAQGFMSNAAYLAIFPGIFIVLLILSFNIIGDSLQKITEPKE